MKKFAVILVFVLFVAVVTSCSLINAEYTTVEVVSLPIGDEVKSYNDKNNLTKGMRAKYANLIFANSDELDNDSLKELAQSLDNIHKVLESYLQSSNSKPIYYVGQTEAKRLDTLLPEIAITIPRNWQGEYIHTLIFLNAYADYEKLHGYWWLQDGLATYLNEQYGNNPPNLYSAEELAERLNTDNIHFCSLSDEYFIYGYVEEDLKLAQSLAYDYTKFLVQKVGDKALLSSFFNGSFDYNKAETKNEWLKTLKTDVDFAPATDAYDYTIKRSPGLHERDPRMKMYGEWLKVETKYYIVNFLSELYTWEDVTTICQIADNSFEIVSNTLGEYAREYTGKTFINVLNSSPTGTSSRGYIELSTKGYYNSSSTLIHEITHDMTQQYPALTWIREGLATYMEFKYAKDNEIEARAVYDAVRNNQIEQLEYTLFDKSLLDNIEEVYEFLYNKKPLIFDDDFKFAIVHCSARNNYKKYPQENRPTGIMTLPAGNIKLYYGESASFTAFLIDQSGFDEFLRVYTDKVTFESVYKRSLDEMLRKWLDYLCVEN